MQTPDERDTVTLDDDRPEVALAGVSFAIIAASLADQLERFAAGYTPVDYLSPIMDARSILLDRHAGDQDMVDGIETSFGTIVASVARAVSLDWGADLEQLGLERGSSSYREDVTELYRFFVTNRLRNARELLYRSVVEDRRRLAAQYRREVEKRNQTTSEARKVFQSFDDVVVWASMPKILAAMRGSDVWSVPLAGVLERLDGPDPAQPDSGFLASASQVLADPTFAHAYVAPALRGHSGLAATALELRDRWLRECPKKPGSQP